MNRREQKMGSLSGPCKWMGHEMEWVWDLGLCKELGEPGPLMKKYVQSIGVAACSVLVGTAMASMHG